MYGLQGPICTLRDELHDQKGNGCKMLYLLSD